MMRVWPPILAYWPVLQPQNTTLASMIAAKFTFCLVVIECVPFRFYFVPVVCAAIPPQTQSRASACARGTERWFRSARDSPEMKAPARMRSSLHAIFLPSPSTCPTPQGTAKSMLPSVLTATVLLFARRSSVAKAGRRQCQPRNHWSKIRTVPFPSAPA